MVAWGKIDDGESCRLDGASDDGCAYSTLRRTMCSLAKDDSGRPVQRCETLQQRLRKCDGRPQEVVDSTVEVTEEDPLSSSVSTHPHSYFSSGYEFSPRHWHAREPGSSGAVIGGELPFPGQFEKKGAAPLDNFLRDIFDTPFPDDILTAQPPADKPTGSFSWFFGPHLGGGNQRVPAARSADQSSQTKADYYEALAKGIQEV